MVKAIRFHKVGGPEVLSWDDIDLPPLGRKIYGFITPLLALIS